MCHPWSVEWTRCASEMTDPSIEQYLDAIWLEREKRPDDWRTAWFEAHTAERDEEWSRTVEAYDKIIALREQGREREQAPGQERAQGQRRADPGWPTAEMPGRVLPLAQAAGSVPG